MGGKTLDSKITREQFTNFFKLLNALEDNEEEDSDYLPFVALYNQIDEDGSNSIELSELRNYFNLLNVFVTDEELSRIFDEIDEDNNKSLSLNEITNILKIIDNDKQETAPSPDKKVNIQK